MRLEKSVSSSVTTAIGILSLLMGACFLALFPVESRVSGVFFMMLCYAVPVAAYEVIVRKIHRAPSTGLNWDRPGDADARRVVLKLVGLVAILGIIAAAHALFRFLPLPRLLDPIVALMVIWPVLVPLVVLYFWEIDKRMHDPRDGYWEFGAWVSGQNAAPDWAKIKDFLIGWAIKGFFLPMMFGYLARSIPNLSANLHHLQDGPVEAVNYLARAVVVMELTIVVVGYTLTVRLFDAHIRSANHLLGAWVVTLVCYEPLNRIVLGRVFDYKPDRRWTEVIDSYPTLYWPWLAIIMGLFLFWLWSAAIFGLRWSNLTNRGIITNGPYRFTKHPSYLSKNLFFWITAAPFLTAMTPWHAVTATAAMFVVNGIYFARARMEEKHLSEDPAYVAYALAMNDHSIFAPLARRVPFLLYKAPGAKGGAGTDTATGAAVPAE